MEGKKNLEQVKDILVIRNGALGDFIVTLPVINSLKQAFANAQIGFIGNQCFFSLAQPYVNKLIPSDLPGFYSLFYSDGDFSENIVRLFNGVDLVVSYTSDPEGIFIKNLGKIGIPWVIDAGFSPRGKLPAPITDCLLAAIEKEGIPVFVEPPQIIPSSGDREIAGEFLRSSGISEEKDYPVIAIHPGSGSSKKCWPKEAFAALMRWAKKDLGATIILVSGPADKEILDEIWPLIKDCSPLVAENLPLTQLAAVFERCSVYAGNDSGITHLAGAVGVLTLALFGPTDAHIWGPRNENVTCLSGSFPCAPCTLKRMAECQDQNCLKSLSVATVKKALSGLISRSCFSGLT